MESEYLYLQPKYVSKFQCDGKICPANCCKRDWRILIDEDAFEKYSQLESSEKEITKHLEKNPEGEGWLIEQNENGCPFMNENCLCSLQKNFGEKYLSQTCLTYPRQLCNFGEIIERTLTPTCPLAADLILNAERLEFEFAKLNLPDWAEGNLIVGETNVPQEIYPCIIDLQLTAVSILQEKRLSIDARLVILGYYLFQAEEIISRGDLKVLETLNKIYRSEEFFVNQVPQLLDSVKFQILEFVETFFTLLKKIYGSQEILTTEGNKKYISQIEKVFGVDFSADEDFNFRELAENYFDLQDIKKIFLEKYSLAFENYLANDFFGGVYPYKVEGTIQQNYAVFIARFKILELTALSIMTLSRGDEKNVRTEIFQMLTDLSMDLNHNENYLAAVAEELKNKSDITILMRGLLNVG